MQIFIRLLFKLNGRNKKISDDEGKMKENALCSQFFLYSFFNIILKIL
jgi:hypothetical protein